MSKDWISDLRKIGELRDLGLLTEDEFQDEKTKILSTRVNAETVSQQSTQIATDDGQEMDGVWETLAGDNSENAIFDVSPYELQEDERIGSYKILGELGIGGMGVVYRARHLEESWALQQGGDVALKIMKPKFAKDHQFRTRFIREAAVGRSIEHANVASVHEVLVEGERLGLVMDLVNGKSLTSIIKDGALAFNHVVKIINPLCFALDHLHSKGIIHRDLKPENIKLTQEEKPVILDFGIAKMDSNEEMTKTGVLMGTVSYMAPEQIDAKKVDAAADRYALGVIVYEMLAGRRPWEKGTSEGRIYTLKLQGALNPLHYMKSDIPMRVSKVVMKMLSTRVEDRYSSCLEFLSDLMDRPLSSFGVSKDKIEEEVTIPNITLTEADLEAARKEYTELMSAVEDLKVGQAAEERNLSSLQKSRDEALEKAEGKIQKIRESADQELEKVVGSEHSSNDGSDKSDRQKEATAEIDSLKKAKSSNLSKYKQAKKEYASGWNSFVSMFSAQKKKELKKSMDGYKKKADEIALEIEKLQKERNKQLKKVEKEVNSKVGMSAKEKEAKVASAHTVRDKKIAIANNHLTAAKERTQSAYEKAKKKIESRLHKINDAMRGKMLRIQEIKSSFPQQVWLIKSTIEVENIVFDMVQIPTGQFWMGVSSMDEDADDDESPRHKVYINRAFWMTTTLVTQQMYETVMKKNPSKKRSSNRPVESVSWFDAIIFCNNISRLSGLQEVYNIDSDDKKLVGLNLTANGFRLPTEAEWEYAARADYEVPYAGSDDINQVACYSANSGYNTNPVGKFRNNAYGLYDMSGNVWEWCWDWYGQYPTTDRHDPLGEEKGSHRVRRGGSFRNKAAHCRVSNRAHSEPSSDSSALGFRIVRTIV
jgi:serine/threonine protein kinase/formylglycine-generating enzyme required for sulfatase activity